VVDTVRVWFRPNTKRPSISIKNVYDVETRNDGTVKIFIIDEFDTDGRSWKRWSYHYYSTSEVERIEFNPLI